MPLSRARQLWSAIDGYVMAAAFVAVAFGIASLLGRILPFTFFLAAVMLAAWFRGAAVGIFATLLSLAALNLLLGTPPYMLGLSAEYMPRYATFSLSALLVVWMSAARRRAEQALRAARDELEDRVRERTASLARTNERLQMESEERKRGERRLTRARRRARERVLEARFAARLEERTRLAREIHDTLLQGFTGVSLQLLSAMGRRNDPAQHEAALGEVVALAQKTLADARQAVWDMRPPALEGDDFAAALGAALHLSVERTTLALDYVVRGVARPMPSECETVVYRVAQEAVTNVMKHAGAHSLRVVLTYRDRGVRLTVTDDGCGFAVDADQRTYAGHWGLLGMRERASQVGGKVRVRSAPGEGTRVALHVPTRAPAERALRVSRGGGFPASTPR
jgi:signal transduction histidine kinase